MSTEHLVGDMGSILEALLGPVDLARQEAEAHLRQLVVAQPGEVLLVLAQIGALGVGGFQLDHRLLTLILLRRLAFTAQPKLFLNSSAQVASAPFDVIRENLRNRIEGVLCAGLKDEMDVRLRKGLGNCAASWAQESAFRQRPCYALPPVMLGLTASSHPFHRYTPFQLLNLTPTLLVDSVSDPIPIEQLGQILLGGMNDPSVDVKVEAIRAVKSVLLEAVTGLEREQVGATLVYEAFQTLQRLPTNVLSLALVPLVELSSYHPNLFLPNLHLILPYLLSLLSPPESSLFPYTFSSYQPFQNINYDAWSEIANPACEILLSLAELRKPQIIAWEEGRVGKEMVGLLIAQQVGAFMDAGEECTDWLEETDLDEEDESYPSGAEEAFDRLAGALGGEILLPALSQHVQALLRQADWRGRYCALLAVGSTAAGCVDELVPRIRDGLNIISPAAKDPHPRVRYAFIQCIGQLLNDCKGVLQTEYAEPILQVLQGFLTDAYARVRCHAVACLANYYGYDALKLKPNDISPIMSHLMPVFNQGPLYVQEQVVATISGICSRAEKAFTPFFEDTMQLLLGILTAPTDTKHFKLVGKSLDCASLIGIAVGKAAFANHAVRLAGIMIGIQNQIVSTEDERNSYLVEAWGTLCQVLGSDFAPFLVHVVPPLLKAASYVPPKPADQYGKLSASEAEEDQQATTHTYEMEEKELAFEQLTVYAFQMGGLFEPYLLESMELSLNALTFQYSENVREAAAYLVPGLLQVAKEAKYSGEDSVFLKRTFEMLVGAIKKETDYGFLSLLYKSFTDSLHVVASPLPSDILTKLLSSTKAHLDSLRSTRTDRALQEPYMDESDREMLLEEQGDEDGCLYDIAEAIRRVKDSMGEGGSPELQWFVEESGRIKKTGLNTGQFRG